MTNPAIDALFDNQMTAGDNQLKNISGLIEREAALSGEIETTEAMTAALKEERQVIRTKDLPTAMLDAGTREFTTDTGLKAKLAFATDGALGSPKTAEEFAEREAKIDLIIANGGGEIVKQVVEVSFPKERAADAEAFRKWVEERMTKEPEKWTGVNVSRNRAINHQTLGSWIRSRMADDDVTKHLPPTFFEKVGIWFGEIAKVTRPKQK